MLAGRAVGDEGLEDDEEAADAPSSAPAVPTKATEHDDPDVEELDAPSSPAAALGDDGLGDAEELADASSFAAPAAFGEEGADAPSSAPAVPLVAQKLGDEELRRVVSTVVGAFSEDWEWHQATTNSVFMACQNAVGVNLSGWQHDIIQAAFMAEVASRAERLAGVEAARLAARDAKWAEEEKARVARGVARAEQQRAEEAKEAARLADDEAERMEAEHANEQRAEEEKARVARAEQQRAEEAARAAKATVVLKLPSRSSVQNATARARFEEAVCNGSFATPANRS